MSDGGIDKIFAGWGGPQFPKEKNPGALLFFTCTYVLQHMFLMKLWGVDPPLLCGDEDMHVRTYSSSY